jgi:hypothetical protein
VLQMPTDATLAPAQMATQSLSYETPFEPHTGRYVEGQPAVGQNGLSWALPARATGVGKNKGIGRMQKTSGKLPGNLSFARKLNQALDHSPMQHHAHRSTTFRQSARVSIVRGSDGGQQSGACLRSNGRRCYNAADAIMPPLCDGAQEEMPGDGGWITECVVGFAHEGLLPSVDARRVGWPSSR